MPQTGYKNPKLVVDGLIIRNQEVLLIKRNITPFKGYWVLPGGHVEYGETVEQAIKREVKEETGLHVKNLSYLEFIQPPKEILAIIAFRSLLLFQTLQAS